MKKKGHKSIPDFSSKRKPGHAGHPGQPPAAKDAGAPPPRVQVIKPQSTSAKGNRRGQ